MIEKIIRLSAKNAIAVLIVTALVSLFVVLHLRDLPLDALPELSDTQVIVFADWAGRAPDIVEDQLTYPLVTSLLATPKAQYVRGVSMYGGSQVTVVFQEGTDLYWARTRILEKLASITLLPQGVVPQIGPEATGLGWVFQYALVDKSARQDLSQLRTLQDWHLRLALQSVPGVAEVASIGGFVKQYQINLDPLKLQAYQLSPLQVVRAVRAGNQELGGGTIELGGTGYSVRMRGYIKNIQDIELIPISTGDQRIVTVRDVAKVAVGPAARVGAAEMDGDGEAVGGIVIMRIGENALTVIDRVKQKLADLKPSLPEGVEIVPVYDRSDLILRAVHNLYRVLTEEVLVVALVVSIFLWHARGSVVAILPLPIAVLLSFLPMLFSGFTVNLMSLGGIALAIGAMVDSGIILVENAHKKLEGRSLGALDVAERRRIVIDAMAEMGRPLFFSLLVITVSFLPIFALTGREGRLFKPLALTKTASMGWAAIMAVTVTPALAVIFLKGRFLPESEHPVSRFIHRIYEPVIAWVLRRRLVVLGMALGAILLTIPVFLAIPTEFMPPLNEGTILYMPTAAPGMGIDTAVELMQKQDTIIKSVPEVEHVFGKAGRANTATDPAPINMFETVITLKPKSAWRAGMTYEKLISELDRKLDFPGMPNIWWMPIQTRVEMLATGIRTALGVKIFGQNLRDIEGTSSEVESILRSIKGTKSAFAERLGSGYFIDIEIERDIAALYGLNIADVQNTVDVALQGVDASTMVEGRERYAIQVRYLSDYRDSLESLNRIVIPTSSGREIALGQVARISVNTGAPMVTSENGRLMGLVFVDIDPKAGMSEYVATAKKEIGSRLRLQPGVSLEWSGQYESLESARRTLLWVAPLTLFLIALLLFLNTRSVVETIIVLLAVPFSLIGAFWLMWLLGYKLSVASWVGILALAGLDAETGVVMLLYLSQAWQRRISAGVRGTQALLREAIHEGAVKRVRPKLMTVFAALIGLLPAMWSLGTGAEVMKRIAAPMVGGLVTSGILELLVYPVLFVLWKGRTLDDPE